MLDEHDAKQNYCRRLGHEVAFSYCRQESKGMPCGRVADCWFEIIPVMEFISGHYTEEEQKQIFAPPKSKAESLLDIIDRVKKSRSSGESQQQVYKN